MPIRTTIILDDDIYEKLVEESIRRYGSVRAILRVVNELLRKSLVSEDELIKLIYSEKLAEIDIRDFEEFCSKLSRRFEDR
jgi:predicted CopG family antitoxin